MIENQGGHGMSAYKRFGCRINGKAAFPTREGVGPGLFDVEMLLACFVSSSAVRETKRSTDLGSRNGVGKG